MRSSLLAAYLYYCVATVAIAMRETDRVAEYHKRGYQWPLNATIPNTEGWRRNQFRRIAQIERIQKNKKKYDAWLHIMASAIVSPNFTENGWGLTRAPADLIKELKTSLHEGLPDAALEKKIEPIETEEPPYFIYQEKLNRKVLENVDFVCALFCVC